MKTRVQKWGNSLAVRIPKSFAADAGLREDGPVDLALAEGQLIIRSLAPKRLTLDQLLSDVTDKNLHGEWSTGRAVGKEMW